MTVLKFGVGDHCERHIDGNWYFATVTSVNKTYVSIQYVDDGKEEMCVPLDPDELRHPYDPTDDVIESLPIVDLTPENGMAVEGPFSAPTAVIDVEEEHNELQLTLSTSSQMKHNFVWNTAPPSTMKDDELVTYHTSQGVALSTHDSRWSAENNERGNVKLKTLFIPSCGMLHSATPVKRYINKIYYWLDDPQRKFVPPNLKPLASMCGFCENYSIFRCERCFETYYCNRRCQKLHWSHHKVYCYSSSESQKPLDRRNEFLKANTDCLTTQRQRAPRAHIKHTVSAAHSTGTTTRAIAGSDSVFRNVTVSRGSGSGGGAGGVRKLSPTIDDDNSSDSDDSDSEWNEGDTSSGIISKTSRNKNNKTSKVVPFDGSGMSSSGGVHNTSPVSAGGATRKLYDVSGTGRIAGSSAVNNKCSVASGTSDQDRVSVAWAQELYRVGSANRNPLRAVHGGGDEDDLELQRFDAPPVQGRVPEQWDWVSSGGGGGGGGDSGHTITVDATTGQRVLKRSASNDSMRTQDISSRGNSPINLPTATGDDDGVPYAAGRGKIFCGDYEIEEEEDDNEVVQNFTRVRAEGYTHLPSQDLHTISGRSNTSSDGTSNKRDAWSGTTTPPTSGFHRTNIIGDGLRSLDLGEFQNHTQLNPMRFHNGHYDMEGIDEEDTVPPLEPLEPANKSRCTSARVRTVSPVNETKLAELMDMGFPPNLAREALELYPLSMDQAVDWIFTKQGGGGGGDDFSGADSLYF